MAAAALNNNGNGNGRQEIEEAIAKAVELRALHAALKQPNTNTNSNSSPAHLTFLSPSHFSTTHHDYPVFTPSYEDEHLPEYVHLQTVGQTICGSWDDSNYTENLQPSNYSRPNVTSKMVLPPGLANMNSHICPGDDAKSVTSSCTNHISFIPNSPGSEFYRSRRRNSLGDFKSVSSCNNCKPAIISTDNDNMSITAPRTDSHAAMNPSQIKSRGTRFSWLFPRLKRRPKNDISSPGRTESEVVSQMLRGFSTVPIEALKKELIDANQKRDAALTEVAEMRSSFGELRKKLETLESYCEELKKALLANSISKRGKLSAVKNGEGLMPVSEEVMIEGFLQVVSEARLAVKQLCKTLLEEIDEKDEQLSDNLNLLLKPYKISLSSRYTKVVSYHLEAIINQTLYQDFENCVFQKNGTQKILDPQQNREAEFQSFAALRNLSWNEVLKKGTKYYSEEFSKFCDQKMSCIIMTLNWTRPWSETLLQCFFVAAKCIWLLHLLAFSFYPPVTILRVEEKRVFDRDYMEDILMDKQKVQNQRGVKVMVMPGFYVQDKILRCKVLCRYK